jgi:uncharacterized repeat protein (TIGR02543 family)
MENDSVVSTNASFTFNVSANRTLVANFTANTPNYYTISVYADPTSGGSVNGGGTYLQNQSCRLTATPAMGYTFVNWTKNGTPVSTNASYIFNVTETATYIAHFQPISYTISVSASPTNGGTVTGGGAYTYGHNCEVTAAPATDYTFLNWTKNGTSVSSNASYTFTVTETATYIAHFQPKSYTISVSASPTNGGTVTGGGVYTYGQNCEVTAAPATGYNFIGWTENGSQVSTNASYSFTVNRNRTLQANFELTHVPSQSLWFEWNGHIFDEGETIECTNDEFGLGEYIQHMQLRNLTSGDLNVIVEKEIVENLEGTSNFFCWGQCFSQEVFVSPFPVLVPANSVTGENDLAFHVLYDEGIYGVVIIKYYAYEENNPSERISIVVRFNRR